MRYLLPLLMIAVALAGAGCQLVDQAMALPRHSQELVEQFVSAYCAGDLDAAYALTSAGYRSRTSRDRFAALADQGACSHGRVVKSTNRGFSAVSNGAQLRSAKLMLRTDFPDGTHGDIAADLVQDSGELRIDRIMVAMVLLDT